MHNRSSYKKQQKLSFMEFLSEIPTFAMLIVSVFFTRTLLVFVDLLDSFGCLLRSALVTRLSKKLSKDLRYEYNYGIGKIEAIASLLCDSIIFFCMLLILGYSVYSLFFTRQPSKFIIAVVALKTINVVSDIVFLVSQGRILKSHKSAISKTNHAAALADLLFDSITLISLLAMWLLRNNPIGAYISPVTSIFIAIYSMMGCIKRIKASTNELTDKTLPEEEQMKILNILARYYDSYAQFHSINSHKSGGVARIDIHLSFEKNTTFEEISKLKNQIRDEVESRLNHCEVNIIVG